MVVFEVNRGPCIAKCCRLIALGTLLAVGAGCSQRLRPIFEPQREPIVWPAGQGPARIRYVGQLRSSADLKPPRSPLRALGELLIGRKKPERMLGPRSVVRTRDGRALWVADPGGRCLHRFDLIDRSYRKAETVGGSPLLSPVGVSLGPGSSIYVCDSESVAVYRLSDQSGALIETVRLPEDVGRPTAIGYADGDDELFLVDVSAHDIKVLGLDGRLRRIIGRRGAGPGEFNFPCAITLDGDMLWVVDAGNQRIQGLTRAGQPIIAFGQPGDAPGDLALPKGVAVDGDGHLYVVDSRYENVQVFDRSGTLLLFFGEEGTQAAEFWLPGGIFIDQEDRIWVCDSYNGRVQVFDYLGDGETEN